jgi:hypothetical protein
MPKLKVGTFPTTVTVSAKSNSLTSGSDGESTFVFPEESGDFVCGICGSGTQSANFSGPCSGGEGGSMFVRTAFGTANEVVDVVEATVVDVALVTLGATVVTGALVTLGASVVTGALVTLGASVVTGALVTLGATVVAGASVVVVVVLVVVEVDVVVEDVVVVVGMGNELESPYWNKRTPAAQRPSNLYIGY